MQQKVKWRAKLFCVAKPGWTSLVLSDWWRAPNVFSLSSYQSFPSSGGNSRSACRYRAGCYYVNNVWATAKKHGYLSDFDIRFGQSRRFCDVATMSGLTPFRDQPASSREVGFVPSATPAQFAPVTNATGSVEAHNYSQSALSLVKLRSVDSCAWSTIS
jgi:hypothetical protein